MMSGSGLAGAGDVLQANEALDILGLGSGASSVEIKAAYRDLVKVWHPDRFGSDARLRQKAEEKLQRINQAYRLLQDYRATGARPPVEPKTGRDGDGPSARYSYAKPIPPVRRVRRDFFSPWWFYCAVGMMVVALVAYARYENRRNRAAPRAVAQPVVDVRAGDTAVATGDVAPNVPGGSNRAGSDAAAGFRVRSLSEADTVRLEEACSSLKGRRDSTAYQACLKA